MKLPLRTTLLCALISILVFSACKKSKDSNPTPPASDNYIKLNADNRKLSLIPNANITLINAVNSSLNEWKFDIVVNTDCSNIDNLGNDKLQVVIDIWDDQLQKNEYDLSAGFTSVYSNPGPAGTASISVIPYIVVAGGGGPLLSGQSGKINITKDGNNKLESVEFLNIPLSTFNGKPFTASGKFTVN